MCDNHGEGMTGTSYCTQAPRYGCDPETWSNTGWPKCCSAPLTLGIDLDIYDMSRTDGFLPHENDWGKLGKWVY